MRLPTSNLQQSRRVLAQDHPPLRAADVDVIEEFYWPLVPHIEAVVAAEHDALRAYFLNQEFHHRFRVHDRIVREALHIRAWRLGKVQLFDLSANLRAVIGSSDQHRQGPSAMRQGNLQFRMTIQDAAKNQMATRDGRVEWI